MKSICHFSSAASESRFFPATGGASADIVFVGSHSAFRETVLAQLTDFDLHVYGPGWKKNSSLPRHHLHNEIFDEQTNLIYNTARINLNIHNWFGRGSTMNLRLFEVPCSGGFLVTDWVAEIDGAFVDAEHLVCYRDMADLRQKISFYLTNAADRQRIATAGPRMCSPITPTASVPRNSMPGAINCWGATRDQKCCRQRPIAE